MARNAWVKLTATPWQRVAGVWSTANKLAGQVTFQWEGGATWHNGSTVSVNPAAPGPAGLWIHAGSSTCYRAVWTPAVAGTFLSSTSSPVCITVKP
ncbi:hypothetical protein GXW82_34190 [Streptacidiphilus sp. 4-A2]|nr:hypothetical protein [Streptacidiphilus sp. 4-A2]